LNSATSLCSLAKLPEPFTLPKEKETEDLKGDFINELPKEKKFEMNTPITIADIKIIMPIFFIDSSKNANIKFITACYNAFKIKKVR
jgi:hypothetical protein